MGEMVITCKGLTKKYKGKEVLHNINLELEHGKIYGLIGRNGAGKTTLLSILSAQNPRTAGELLFNGESVWENEEVLKHIYFSREINIGTGSNISGLKVKEYLKMAKQYLPGWDQELADRLIQLFHLDVRKRIMKLSKGMASMLSILMALASKAEFTFLDEPVAGLDVVAREQFYRILLEEFTETGRTFVISTHIIEEAADLFEEVIFLHEGKILLKENTQELLERSFYISGKTEEVDRAVAGIETHHEETFGRSKSVMVKLSENQQLEHTEAVTVRPLNLQNVFVSLCSGEDE